MGRIKYTLAVTLAVTLAFTIFVCFSGCSSQPAEQSNKTIESSQKEADNVTTSQKSEEANSTIEEELAIPEDKAYEEQTSSKDNKDEEQTISKKESQEEEQITDPWLFGQKDIYINNQPVLDITYEQALLDFGNPKKINMLEVNPSAADPDFYNYFAVLVYDGLECELNLGEEDRKQLETDKVFRFDITNANVQLDCGLKVGMTTDEVLSKFGKRTIYNISSSDEDSELISIKHVLESYKPKDYYSGYSHAMIIYSDQGKFDDPLAKALVLLVKNKKIDRIVFGYPTAD